MSVQANWVTKAVADLAPLEDRLELEYNRYQSQMRYWSLIKFGRLYTGYVDPAEVSKRRKRNKAARKQRRVNRLRNG